MENTQSLKKRIKSVANINKITKAMELVAATKMRRSQEVAIASHPYAFAVLDMMATVSSLEQKLPPLFEVRRNIKKVLFIVVASDKGLAGAFNSSVFKKFESHMERDKEKYKREEKLYVAIGEKAFAYLQRKKVTIVQKFIEAGDYTTPDQVKPIVDFVVQGYLEKKFDRVIVVSTHFRSALKQEPHVRRVLPIDYDHIADTVKQIIPEKGKFAELIKEHNITFVPDIKKSKRYTIEPEPDKVLEKLAEHLFFIQIYHLILEANASEHSARRMAMKTASDNASDLGETLNLQYNKSRQSAITNQIIEIVSGAESLN